MSRLSKIIAIMVLGLNIVPAASAQRRFGPRLVVRPFGYFGPVAFGPSWYWGAGWYPWAGVGPSTGQVKIDTGRKDVSVYVDGGYVGPIRKFKTFDLLPGNHDIELRDPASQVIFHERIQVILGKRTDIRSPV